MSTVKNERIVPLTGTDAGLTALNPVPYQSELVIVKPMSGIGQYGIKIGDGLNNYSALPFFTNGGTGDYLGLAVTSTVPPTLSSDAYYLTTVHGTFVNLSGVVVPGTSLLSVISYDFAGGGWVTAEVLDSSIISAPGLTGVLTTNNISNNLAMIFKDSAGNQSIQIGPGVNNGFVAVMTTAADTFGVAIEAGPTPLSNGMYITWNGKHAGLYADLITANRAFQYPDEPGTIVVHNTKTPIYNNNGTEAAVLDAGNQQVGICAPDNVTPWAVLSVAAAHQGYIALASNASAGINIAADTTDTAYRFFTLPQRGSISNRQTLQLSGDQVNPTIGFASGSGTGASATFSATSDDRSGSLVLVTGTTPTIGVTIATITFSQPSQTKTRVLINVITAAGVVSNNLMFAAGESKTSFSLVCSSAAALAAATQYTITYIVQN